MRPLAVTGNVNVDLIMGPVTPWPRPGTEVVTAHDDLRPGGSAGNTALAWSGLEVPFTLASGVGDDAFGRWLADAFAPHSARWPAHPTATTISVALTHPDAERTFFTTRGHLPELGWTDVRDQLDRAELQGGILLVCASFLTDRLTADYPALFRWAEARGIEVALDPGWPAEGWTEAQRARARGWLAHTHHLLVNEIEAMALTGTADIAAALPELARMLPRRATAVVKAGPHGAHATGPHGTCHAAAPVVRVIDTIGAGDIFNAGYLLATAKGAAMPQAVAAAVALASNAIASSPRAYDMPTSLKGAA